MSRLTLAWLLLLLLAPWTRTSGATIHVPDGQPTIQDGIDAASEGDTVLVAPGTYVGELNRGLDFGMKNITLRSESGAEETTIDCEHQDRAFHFHGGQDPTSLVKGFTVLNGAAEMGGGIYCDQSSPAIASCTFSGNAADEGGGGIYCDQSSPTIAGCVFSENSAGGFYAGGGGIGCRLSSPSVTDCAFSGNTSDHGGGGLHCYEDSSPSVTDCTFTGNDALYGGGMSCRFSSPTVTGCTFSAGTAGSGGAVHGDHSSPTITDCAFTGNTADSHGGAMRFVSFCSATITGCTFSENGAYRGGGVSGDECSLGIANCTFSENTADYCGGGLWLFCEDSYPTITDCVFSGNSANSSGGGIWCFGFEPTVAGCIFSGNSAGQHGGGLCCVWYWLTVTSCTFFGNTAGGLGGGVYSDDASLTITNTIVSFSPDGGAIACEGSTVPEITRCCFFGNIGSAGDSLCGAYYDNLFADPAFCDAESGDFSLREDSPCLPPNNSWNELVGALGLGCDTSIVQPTSWGALKARFR